MPTMPEPAPVEPVIGTIANTEPAAPIQVPEDHPLVVTLGKLRAENAELKKAKTADKTTDADHAKTKAEAANLRLALKYGLSETDAALLPAGDGAEALAKRLAETKPNGATLPVITELGQSGNTTVDAATEFAQLMEKAFNK